MLEETGEFDKNDWYWLLVYHPDAFKMLSSFFTPVFNQYVSCYHFMSSCLFEDGNKPYKYVRKTRKRQKEKENQQMMCVNNKWERYLSKRLSVGDNLVIWTEVLWDTSNEQCQIIGKYPVIDMEKSCFSTFFHEVKASYSSFLSIDSSCHALRVCTRTNRQFFLLSNQ